MCRVHLIDLAARQTYNKNPVVGQISEMVQKTLRIQRNTNTSVINTFCSLKRPTEV